MRLIDADAINPMRCPKSISEMREWINGQPTVCDIGQIRTDIKSLKIHGTDDVSITNNFVIDKVLQIIDKHMKGDSK